MEKDNQSTQEINSQAQNPLGIAPVGGLIAKFAIPAIISMLVSAMYNIVDQIFIGQGVGMLGNAATNVAFPVTTVATGNQWSDTCCDCTDVPETTSDIVRSNCRCYALCC